jgi:hypothetical protein
VSIISPEMRAQIGSETAPYSLVIEAGDLARFAEMIEADVVGAGSPAGPGGSVAAPTYLIVMRQLETRALAALYLRIPYTNGVDGGSDWEYFEPIRPGDTIRATARLADYQERQTSFGATLFQVFEMTYRNQFDRIVVRQRDTRIFFA